MNRIAGLLALTLCATAPCFAVEVLRWERLPLSVRLIVGQERVVLIDRNVRVGVPSDVSDHLRVQSAGGALYLKADAPIAGTRLQLQDAETGALILLDLVAEPAPPGEPPLEPLRIMDGTSPSRAEMHGEDDANTQVDSPGAAIATPIPVLLTRYAAQSLYAPLRTVEPINGIVPVALRRTLALDTLLPGLPVRATALAAWRLKEYWITAIKLTHTRSGWLELDPRALQGNFFAAAFQHPSLGPAGESTDTTVAYLITRGYGLTESLLPAVAPFDPAINLPHQMPEGVRP